MSDWLASLRSQTPLHHPGQAVLDSAQAAVLFPITDCAQEPHVILTRRADHLNSHAGEVAFPGGKRDPEDASVLETALRESFEEISLPPEQVELLGPMPVSISKMGLQVVPVMGIIPHQQELVASEDEIESIFRVPLRFFLESPPNEVVERSYQGRVYQVPCYHYQGYMIWGLTAYFITDCLNRIFNTGYDAALVRPRPISRSSDSQ